MVRHTGVILRIVLLVVVTVSSLTAAPPGLDSQPIDSVAGSRCFSTGN